MPQLQQQRSLALVVGCTQGKTLPTPEHLRMRNQDHGADRCRMWAERVREGSQTLKLRELYKGQQWLASLALEETAASAYASVRLWIVSAGLGLRRAEETAPGYGAAFTAGPDAVAPVLRGRRDWWAELQERTGGSSFQDVRATADDMLVVLSPSYLSVVEPQLEAVDDEGVAIVTSTSSGRTRTINSGGLQLTLGGSDQTLNLRAAGRLIGLATAAPIGARSVLEAYTAWAEPLRTVRSYDRTSLDDDALREIIRAAGATGRTSATMLLKQLRLDGMACEQKRFHRLYAEVRGTAA